MEYDVEKLKRQITKLHNEVLFLQGIVYAIVGFLIIKFYRPEAWEIWFFAAITLVYTVFKILTSKAFERGLNIASIVGLKVSTSKTLFAFYCFLALFIFVPIAYGAYQEPNPLAFVLIGYSLGAFWLLNKKLQKTRSLKQN